MSFPEHITACEILSTAICPLDCSYCYIPKTKEMKAIHDKIIEDIKSNQYIERLKKLYGANLKFLGFWGTEPTLTLSLIQEKLPLIFENFPKLEKISFSTAMITDPEILLGFVKALSGSNITLDVQISLDGPAFITDKNRMKGAAELIPKNFEHVLREMNEIDLGELKIKFHWKATLTPDNLKEMGEDPEKIKQYFIYFKNVNEMIKETNKQKNVSFNYKSGRPTLMLPGKYTSNDGKIFAKFIKGVHFLDKDTTYTSRLQRMFDYEENLLKRRQFSCSGGDGNFGLGEELHICHRTFYLNDENYIEAIMKEESSKGDIDNWDVSIFKRGAIETIKKRYIIDINDEADMWRFLYVMRGYHDFWRHQLASTDAILRELAFAGQIDRRYLKDDSLRFLFTVFLHLAASCPMENLLNSGSIHIQLISLMRMFGNGAFQEILKRVDVK